MKILSFNRFALLGLATLPMTTQATVRDWNGSNGMDWNTSNTSWTGTTWNNATSDQAVFGTTGIGTISLTTAITANKLTFNTGGYTIVGNTLTLSGTTPAILNTAGANAINSNITLGAATTFTNSDASNNLTLGGTVAKGTNALTISGAGTVAITGGLSGTGGLYLNAGSNVSYSATGGTTSDFRIGNNSNSGTNTFNINSGDLTVTNFLYFSQDTGSSGVLNQTGGTLNLNGIRGANQTGGITAINLSGGILNNNSDAFMLTQRGATTMTVSNTAQVNVTQITMCGWAGIGSSIVNLDGGTLTTNGLWETTGSGLSPAANGNYTTTVNFNGGLLKARSAGQAANFLNFVDNAYVKEGGAKIDTNTYSVTIAKALSHGGVAATDGGLTKSGSGTLTITGDNTYTGDTTIDGGTLALKTPNFNTYRGGQIHINNGSTLKVEDGGGAHRYDFPTQTYQFDTNGGGSLTTVGTSLNWVAQGDWTFKTNGGARNNINGATGMNMNGSKSVVLDVAGGTDATCDLNVAIGIGNTTGGLTKSGAGIANLSTGNGYNGATTVKAGRLNVNGSITSAATVGATGTTATLGGDGTITGAVTLGANGILRPGQGGATDRSLTITGNVTTTLGSQMIFNLDGEAAYDQLICTTGNVDISSAQLGINLTDTSFTMLAQGMGNAFLLDPAASGASYYKLISGTTSGMFTNVTNTMTAEELGYYGLSGTQYTLTENGQEFWVAQGSTYLVAIPEPSAALLLGLGSLGLALRRRRA